MTTPLKGLVSVMLRINPPLSLLRIATGRRQTRWLFTKHSEFAPGITRDKFIEQSESGIRNWVFHIQIPTLTTVPRCLLNPSLLSQEILQLPCAAAPLLVAHASISHFFSNTMTLQSIFVISCCYVTNPMTLKQLDFQTVLIFQNECLADPPFLLSITFHETSSNSWPFRSQHHSTALTFSITCYFFSSLFKPTCFAFLTGLVIVSCE